VLGPRRAALDPAAIERGRVVRGHRAVVVSSVAVDEFHALDRKPDAKEDAKDAPDGPRLILVDDELAAMGLAVEAPVGERDEAKVLERKRATGTP
jgi:hypothetical protein